MFSWATARYLLGQNEHYTEGKIFRWKNMLVPLEIFHEQFNVPLDVKNRAKYKKSNPTVSTDSPEFYNNPNGDNISSAVLPAHKISRKV